MRAKTVSGVQGLRLRLRLITPEDADFVHGLRVDPTLNRHLSPVTGDADGQRQWISAYKARQAAGQEFYYVMCSKTDGAPCGTVRLYGIEPDSLTWGSFILGPTKPRKAALESALLSFSIAFDVLEKQSARIDVERDNARAIAFYRRFGMTQNGQSETELFFDYPRSRFDADRETLILNLEEPA